jgi:uncharacterized protein YqhQ
MFSERKVPSKGDSLFNRPLPKKREEQLRVGGQAVIEGVMMRSPSSMAIAVRKPNGEITVRRERLTFFSEKMFCFKLPLVRGVIALLSALILGIQALNFSANQTLSEGEKEPSPWTMSVTFAVALCFGIFLFFLIPLFLTRWLRFAIPMLSESGLLFNLVDGAIRLMIFLAYLWAISFLKEIERIFQIDLCLRIWWRIDHRSCERIQLSPSQVWYELPAHRHGGEHFGLCHHPTSPLVWV